MNFSEFMFVLQFLTYIGIFLVTLYNIFSVGKFYDIKMMWILFISQLINYAVGMSIVMTLDTAYWAQTEIIGVLYQLEVYMFVLYFVMLAVQLIMAWRAEALQPVQARKSAEMRNNR